MICESSYNCIENISNDNLPQNRINQLSTYFKEKIFPNNDKISLNIPDIPKGQSRFYPDLSASQQDFFDELDIDEYGSRIRENEFKNNGNTNLGNSSSMNLEDNNHENDYDMNKASKQGSGIHAMLLQDRI